MRTILRALRCAKKANMTAFERAFPAQSMQRDRTSRTMHAASFARTATLSLIVLSAASLSRIERNICDHRAGAISSLKKTKDSCRRAAEHSLSWRKVEGAEHAVRDSRREQCGRLACTPRPLSARTGQRRAQTPSRRAAEGPFGCSARWEWDLSG